MKKLLQITYCFIICSALLTACKGNEKDNEAKKSSIIGTWAVTQFDVNISIDGITLADYLIDSLEFSAQEVTIAEALIRSEVDALFENETISFKADQTYEVFIDDSLETGYWSLNEDQSELVISTVGGQEVALAINSISEEVLQIGINELVQIDDIFDTSSFGIGLTESLLIEGSFTLIKEK